MIAKSQSQSQHHYPATTSHPPQPNLTLPSAHLTDFLRACGIPAHAPRGGSHDGEDVLLGVSCK